MNAFAIFFQDIFHKKNPPGLPADFFYDVSPDGADDISICAGKRSPDIVVCGFRLEKPAALPLFRTLQNRIQRTAQKAVDHAQQQADDLLGDYKYVHVK